MRPLIKWAGGKSWLDLPESSGRWIEPFAGSAAQFFKRLPEHAILCDSNTHLINLYWQLQRQPEALLAAVPERIESDASYKALRSLHNRGHLGNDLPPAARAAVFLALNRTCFNGLWRENLRGEFNVPWCKDPDRVVRQDLTDQARALLNAECIAGDFSKACDMARPGDTVYMDPPYYETWDTYQPGGFGPEDHIRVYIKAAALRSLGCQVWLSYNDHHQIRQLYAGWSVRYVEAPRGVKGGRSKAPELLITG